MANVSENRKKQFLLHFDPVFRVDVLINGVEDAPFWQLFLSNLYLFNPIFFSGVVLIDKLHDTDERICFFNDDCHRKGKGHYQLP